VPPIFERALGECRARTVEHVSLPSGDRIEIEDVTDGPWNGYSRHHGGYRSVLQVNLAYGITIDGALALACHEGYPGRHARNGIREARDLNSFVDVQTAPRLFCIPRADRAVLRSTRIFVKKPQALYKKRSPPPWRVSCFSTTVDRGFDI
jgi:hypothetical protein